MEIEMLDWILEHAMKHGYDDLFFKITSEFTENEIRINFPRFCKQKLFHTFESHELVYPDYLVLLEDMMTSLKSETMCEFEEIQCVLIAIFLLNNLKVVDDGEERMKIVLVDWEAVKENLTYQDDNFKDYYTKNVRDIHAAIDASSQEDVDRHMDRLLREQLRNLMVALKTPTVSSYLEKINGGEVVVEIAIQNTPEYNMLLHAFEEQLSEASLSKLTQRLLNMRKSRVEKQAGNLKEPQTSKNTGTGAKENISRNKELCVSKGSPSDSCVRYTIMTLCSEKVTLAIPADVKRYSIFKELNLENSNCTPDPWSKNEINELKDVFNKLQNYDMKLKKFLDQNRLKTREGRDGLSPEIYLNSGSVPSETLETDDETIIYRETSHMETDGDCETSCDKNTPVDVETSCDKDTPVNVETSPDKDPPVNVETSPDKDTPVDVEASPDKDPPVDVEASPDKDPPVNVEASPDKDTPVDVEASPDKDPPVDVEASPDKDPPVDVEASPDKDTPVNVEASPDKDTPVDVEASPDKDTPVDVEASPDKDTPVNVETSPDKDPPVDVEASPDKDPPVDVEASPDKDPPVDVEASPDKDPPVDVEASPDKDTPVDVETSPDKDTPVDVETDIENSDDNAVESSDTQCQGSSGSVSEWEAVEINENVQGVASLLARSSRVRKQLFPEATNKESVGSNSVPVGDKSLSSSLRTYVKGKDSTNSGSNLSGDEFGQPKKRTRYSLRNIKEENSGSNTSGDEFGQPKKRTRYSLRNIKEENSGSNTSGDEFGQLKKRTRYSLRNIKEENSGSNTSGDEFGQPKKRTRYSLSNIKEGGSLDYDNNETIDCKKLNQGKDCKLMGRCSVRLTKIQLFSVGKTRSCDSNL
ncbi:clumping factor B-like isoform X2 [Homarus americanus]|uniref:clumping factor B-like isoform X2 n=1 Tax=Homarus americanus TaxID=6706 RepID=UPI001C43A2C4|nr:clumping factor B-like isoform X2 [Homarus americanus]